MSDKNRLLEAVADIAYMAGTKGYYSGDSRRDMATFIAWAQEFEAGRKEDAEGNEQYFGEEYMSAIETFTNRKLSESA